MLTYGALHVPAWQLYHGVCELRCYLVPVALVKICVYELRGVNKK
jgi:hypothetical protein